MTAAQPVTVVREAAQALALLDPERMRLVQALASAPDSASGLARRLGEKRQRLNYHLRVLEEAGLVEVAEERQRGNCTERVLRLVARRFVLDPATIGGVAAADPEEVGDRFSATYLIALANRAVRELAELLDQARAQPARVASASVNASVRVRSPAVFQELVRDLTTAVASVIATHHDEAGDGRWFRVIGGVYPGPPPTAETRQTDG